jgi:hypothetical protein
MAFFLLANLAGVVRPMGLKPFRFTGFPFIISAWGFGMEEFFDWSALALNAAVGVSGAVALGCAWARSRCGAVPGPGSPP